MDSLDNKLNIRADVNSRVLQGNVIRFVMQRFRLLIKRKKRLFNDLSCGEDLNNS